MKYLLFDHIPLDTEVAKDTEKNTALAGTQVYTTGFAKALLKYGSFDRYLFFSRNPFAKLPSSPIVTESDRASVINLADLHTLYPNREVIIASPSPFMTARTPLRKNNPYHLWPLTGVIHSVCSVDIPTITLGLLQASFTKADALVCSSHAGKAVIENIFSLIEGRHNNTAACCPVELPVIPLGIETEDFSLDQEKSAIRSALAILVDAVVILYLGRLSPLSKGDLWPILRTIAKEVIPSAQAPVEIIVAGDDTQHHMAAVISEYASKLGISQYVKVYPDLSNDEKRTLLAAADIFLAPSDNVQETFGISVAEAMASGLPIVASDWNGYRELFEDGRSGFVIKTSWMNLGPDLESIGLYGTFWLRNAALASSTVLDLDQLRDRLILLINNGKLRRDMGRHARTEARRYNWATIIRRYETLWATLLQRASDPSVQISHHRSDPVSYPAQKVFAHYPSEWIDDKLLLRISRRGEQLLRSDESFAEVVSPVGIINNDYAAQLLTKIAALRICSIQDVLPIADDSGGPDFIARVHTAYLLKYGFLEIVTNQTSSGETSQFFSTR